MSKRQLTKDQRDTAMGLLSEAQREAYNALGMEAVGLEIVSGNLKRRADNLRLARTREKNALVLRRGLAKHDAAKRAKAKFNGQITEYARKAAAQWKAAKKQRAAMDSMLRGVLKDAKACGVLAEMKRASAVAAPETQQRSA